MTKRLRPLEDPDQAAGDETADRCVFWSGEQNRWVDVISAWILERDPWQPGEGEHRGFSLVVDGDVCMPLAVEPLIEIGIGTETKRVAARITMAAPLWRELSAGWHKFARETKKAIYSRCGLKGLCTYSRRDKRNRIACGLCDVTDIHLSWGSLVRCHAIKIPAADPPPPEVK
jgi:hypothetical protein